MALSNMGKMLFLCGFLLFVRLGFFLCLNIFICHSSRTQVFPGLYQGSACQQEIAGTAPCVKLVI